MSAASKANMGRRSFQAAAAASFVLCVAVHVLWLQSYRHSERFAWESTRISFSLQTVKGHFEVGLFGDLSNHPGTQAHGFKYERVEVRSPLNHFLLLCSSYDDKKVAREWGGFAWYAQLNSIQGIHHSITVVPCWFLAPITRLLPLVASTLRLRRAAGLLTATRHVHRQATGFTGSSRRVE